ncbi:MAG: cysteine--tRNA ligase [Candidatus Spechtbacterales bacterium]|nr:cysteine--tRNA ligase [Candidatus Spechtbacterales bacterium]
MKLYDTLTKEKKGLKPLKDKEVGIFVCGPTVYDLSHIGHARTYVAFDMFVKYLRHAGYKVNYIQNITDIDDKIIKRAKENNEDTRQLAKRFEEEYYKDMASLGINSVDSYRRATDHIDEIISQVERLLKEGFAYEIENDGIYFNISKFKDYGKLSGRTAEAAEDATSRIDESVNKKNKGDFALWKLSKPAEPKWPSPWGDGRPGWHIEDTAITEKHLGEQYDIPGGARDLIFPHHEAEIAQMEAISGKKPLVNYWMHSGFLTVGGEKMGKSLGNFVTIREALENYSPQTLRLFFITKHYRSPIDFTQEGLQEAKSNTEKIEEFLLNLEKIKINNEKGELKEIQTYMQNFWNYLEDDFNTPRAFAELFQLINFIYKTETISDKDQEKVIEFIGDINNIFNIIDLEKLSASVSIPPDIIKLVDEREKAREEKNWDKADELREEIEKRGYNLKDTDEGPQIKKK